MITCQINRTSSQKQNSTAIVLENAYGGGKHVVIIPHKYEKSLLKNPINNFMLLTFNSA